MFTGEWNKADTKNLLGFDFTIRFFYHHQRLIIKSQTNGYLFRPPAIIVVVANIL
jgi:hypothetical protein